MLVIEILSMINDILPELRMLKPVHRIHAQKKIYIDRHQLQKINIMLFFSYSVIPPQLSGKHLYTHERVVSSLASWIIIDK